MRRIYTWEGEFYALDHAEAKARLAAGIELFRRRGWPLHGFVAPAWLMSAGTRQALGESGLRYTSDPSNLYRLPHLQPIEAPGLVWSARSAWRRGLSWALSEQRRRAWRAAPVIRLDSIRSTCAIAFPANTGCVPCAPCCPRTPAADQDRLAGAPPRPGPRGMSRGWLLLFGLIGASLIPLVLGGSDMFPRLRAFPLDSLLLMFGMIVVCWFINGLRLRLLLAGRAGKLGQLQSVGIIMASEFAFCATPGGSGGPLTLMALLARRGLRPAQTSAVFAVDQLADLTFFLCALGAILIYALSHSLSPNMESSLIFSAVFLVGLFVGAVMLIRYLHQVIRFNGRVLARLGVSSRKRLHWGRKILHFRIALHDSLRLPKRRLLAVFLLSSTHWLLRFSVLDLTLRGLGVDIQWAWTFLIQMVSLSAGQLSLIPGGAGGTELTSAALLAPMIGKSTAAAAIVIWRAVTFYFYLVAGGRCSPCSPDARC